MSLTVPPSIIESKAKGSRQANSVAVLRLLLHSGPSSRRHISQVLGLTQSAITRIVNQLIDAGILKEQPNGDTQRGRGRPQVPVAICPDVFHVIGVHIGVGQISASLVDITSKPIYTIREDFDGTPEDALKVINRVVHSLAANAEKQLSGISVVLGGWVDPTSGIAHVHNALDWHEVDLATPLQKALGDLNCRIIVDSSTRAHAKADLMFGLTSDSDSFLHVFVGNIAEIAFMTNGSLVVAEDGFGGDIAPCPIPGQPGKTVQNSLLDSVLLKKAQEANIPNIKDFEALVECASEEDNPYQKQAYDLLAERARGVGSVLGLISAVMRPNTIVVSAGVVALPTLIDEVAKSAEKQFPKADITPRLIAGDYGPKSVSRAAAALVIERILSEDLPP